MLERRAVFAASRGVRVARPRACGVAHTEQVRGHRVCAERVLEAPRRGSRLLHRVSDLRAKFALSLLARQARQQSDLHRFRDASIVRAHRRAPEDLATRSVSRAEAAARVGRVRRSESAQTRAGRSGLAPQDHSHQLRRRGMMRLQTRSSTRGRRDPTRSAPSDIREQAPNQHFVAQAGALLAQHPQPYPPKRARPMFRERRLHRGWRKRQARGDATQDRDDGA